MKQMQTFILSHIQLFLVCFCFCYPQKYIVLLGTSLSWRDHWHPLIKQFPEGLKESLSFTVSWGVEETIYSGLA